MQIEADIFLTIVTGVALAAVGGGLGAAYAERRRRGRVIARRAKRGAGVRLNPVTVAMLEDGCLGGDGKPCDLPGIGDVYEDEGGVRYSRQAPSVWVRL